MEHRASSEVLALGLEGGARSGQTPGLSLILTRAAFLSSVLSIRFVCKLLLEEVDSWP